MDSKKFANRFRGSWSGATSKLQLNSRAPGFGCDHASQNRVQGRVPSRVPLGIAFFLELPALNRTPPPPLPSPLLFSRSLSAPSPPSLCSSNERQWREIRMRRTTRKASRRRYPARCERA